MEGTQQDTGPVHAASCDRRQTRQNGFAVAALRKKDGKSQTALAREIGLTQPALSLIESEATSAYLSTIMLIAQALDVPVAAILRASAEPVPSLATGGKAA